MSQPASPIGSVEFIVKFETMGGSFVKALTEAFKEADFDLGGAVDTKKLDEILFNLRTRIRQPFTGERLNFLREAVPHKTFFEDPSTRKSLEEWFLTETVGKRMLPKGEGEEQDAYDERLKKTVDSFMDSAVSMIEKGVKNKDYWQKHAIDFVDISSGFTEALKGNWNFLMRNVFRKVMKEHQLEDVLRESITAGTFESLKTLTGQKRRSVITEAAGTGETPLEGFENTIPALINKVGLENFLKRVQGVELDDMDEYQTNIDEFLGEFTVAALTKLPNIIAEDLGVEYQKTEGYRLLDLPIFLEGVEGLEEFKEWAKQYDLPSEAKFNEWTDQLEEQINEFGVALVQFEGKLEATEELELQAKGKYGSTAALFAMLGKPIMQVIPEFQTKQSDVVLQEVKEALKVVFGDALSLILEAIKVDENLMKEFIEAIKDNPAIVHGSGT